MTADLIALERKVDLVACQTKLILATLEDLRSAGKPGLTQVQFAALIGKHPRTVGRWIASKKVRFEKGVIPHSEVTKYLS